MFDVVSEPAELECISGVHSKILEIDALHDPRRPCRFESRYLKTFALLDEGSGEALTRCALFL